MEENDILVQLEVNYIGTIIRKKIDISRSAVFYLFILQH